jgi:hypothetical protein
MKIDSQEAMWLSPCKNLIAFALGVIKDDWAIESSWTSKQLDHRTANARQVHSKFNSRVSRWIVADL